MSDGYIGMGPWIVKEDDVVVVLSGGKVPYCLRLVHDSGNIFLRECYIHGVMFGERWEEDNTRTFNLI